MNVIVVVTDSLRADHVGCYGHSWIQTPGIDQFAEDATLFEHAYTEGLPTGPTRYAFWTGRYTFPFRGWKPFDPTDVTLAEVLWDQGFTSALITDVYHLHKPGTSWGRGFDTVQFIRGQEYDPFIMDSRFKVDLDARHRLRGDASDRLWKPRFEQYLRNISGWNWWKSDEDHFVAQVVKAGLRWLEAQQGKDRVFLWLDCFDPHEPWDPPEPYNQMYDPDYTGPDLIDPVPGPVEGYLTQAELNHIKALYAGEVTIVDKWVGIFFEEARRMGYFDHSLIIYTTDHGEPFGEHGIVRKARRWPYEEQVRIPFILRHPEVGHGKRTDALIQTCDMMPTILDFVGVEGPRGMHGQSLLPLVSGQAEQLREYAYSGWFNASWSIRNHDWSYILWLDIEEKTKPELYNRREDLYEQHNLVGQEPELAEALELEMRRFVAGLKWETP